MEKLPQDKPIVKILESFSLESLTKEGWYPTYDRGWSDRASLNKGGVLVREEPFGAIIYGDKAVYTVNKPAFDLVKPILSSPQEIERLLQKYLC